MIEAVDKNEGLDLRAGRGWWCSSLPVCVFDCVSAAAGRWSPDLRWMMGVCYGQKKIQQLGTPAQRFRFTNPVSSLLWPGDFGLLGKASSRSLFSIWDSRTKDHISRRFQSNGIHKPELLDSATFVYGMVLREQRTVLSASSRSSSPDSIDYLR